MEKLAEQIREKARNGTLLVYRDPPPGEPPNLLDAVGLVSGSEFDDGQITVEIQDFGPNDVPLVKLIEEGIAEVNPVSYGSVTTLPDGTQVVEDAEFSHFTLDKSPPKPKS
ncbi:hypothetical protein LCGC14_0165030 [marine sediment metagenome]|uniref:Uncharacterized protein n=1 Tax=marine sediment metagenome TaxID=412755 RepID=A0A0F9UYR1_9ZZZZ